MLERGLAGSPCYTPAGWLETLPGKALARHPLINYKQVPRSSAADQVNKVPSFSKMPSNDTRPLAGVKVLELARIIAAPACGAVLASMGAEVIRIQTVRLMDFTVSTYMDPLSHLVLIIC